MKMDLAAAARVFPITALILAACVAKSVCEQQGRPLQQARTQAAAE